MFAELALSLVILEIYITPPWNIDIAFQIKRASVIDQNKKL